MHKPQGSLFWDFVVRLSDPCVTVLTVAPKLLKLRTLNLT